MLSFFPAPYPDELWYSVLSRYFAYSGYFAKCRNNSVNRDLLGNIGMTKDACLKHGFGRASFI